MHLERFCKKSAGRLATEDKIHAVQETLPAVLTPVFTLMGQRHSGKALPKAFQLFYRKVRGRKDAAYECQ